MGHTRLTNICQDILARWSEKKEIDEEQNHIFFDGILDTISCTEEEKESSYEIVSAKINEMWQYKNFDMMSMESVFLCGGLWGAIKLVEMSRKREKQQKTIEELACVYVDKLWIFDAISSRPGIRHKDLACMGKQSASQLSQCMARIVQEGLVSYNRIGREKYYYLQKRGELVYAEIRKKYIEKYREEYMEWWKRLSISDEVQRPASLSNEAVYLYPTACERIVPSLRGEAIPFNMRPLVQTRIEPHKRWTLNNDENENMEIFSFGKEELDIPCKIQMESIMAIVNN